ncbi:MAG: type II secretion system protein [Arenicellales bacterium]
MGGIVTVRQAGFTLLEAAVVLVIIGLILGAVSIGKDLHRNAEQEIVYAKFIQPWAAAYNEYFARTGVVVGDSETSPTLKVNGNTKILCDDDSGTAGQLLDLMDDVGIDPPPGRAEGHEDRYIRLDTNGNPQEIQVCFKNIEWPDSTNVSLNNKNVMIIRGLNPDLARHLDATIDGRPDARFGLFRQAARNCNAHPGQPGGVSNPNGSVCGTASLEWRPDNETNFNGNARNYDEDQVSVVTAVYRMNE